MLDVRRLRLLREVHVRGTIAAVAAAIHQSPSSVSQQLNQLEREVGVDLLRKVGRRVQLTSEAELLVAHAEAVLERLELAESDLLAAADEVGVLDVYPAREEPVGPLAGVSGLDVARSAADHSAGRPVWWLADADGAERAFGERLGEGDLLVTIGAGDIHLLATKLVEGGAA